MISDIGLFALVIAFGLSVYATISSAYGGLRGRPAWVESARNASLIAFPLLSISVAAVVYSLYVMDFSKAYVYDVASTAMSVFFRVTALWGGQQGSVLFWAWIMSCFVMIVMLRKWDKDRELMPYVITVSMLTTAFFVGVALFITNPFQKLWIVPGAQDLVQAVFRPAASILENQAFKAQMAQMQNQGEKLQTEVEKCSKTIFGSFFAHSNWIFLYC